MTQYNKLNVKLSNSQLNKLKSVTKIGTEVTLNLSSNLIGSSNYETNFPHKLLINKHISKICKALENGLKLYNWKDLYLVHLSLKKD